jgi:hypothetical protein
VLAKLRPHLTYANVMATFAVFLGLSTGGAYAANTIFSSDIVDGQVKTPDLASAAVAPDKLAGGAVTSEKVKDNSLAGRDVFDNSLKGADIDESTLTSIGGGGPAGGDLTGSYPNPLIAQNAVGPGKISNAPSGSDNVNADTLDGLDSSVFARTDCQGSGVVMGSAKINADPAFSSEFVDVGGYNCSGGTIQARRIQEGLYGVRFNGVSTFRALASTMQFPATAPFVRTVNIALDFAQTYYVGIVNPATLQGHDTPFFIAVF